MESVAEHGYKISISGTGADELFSGYYDHHLAYLYEVRDDQELLEASLQNWERHVKPLVQNPHLKNPKLFMENPEFRDHVFLDAKAFASYLKKDWFEEFEEEKLCKDLLRNRMLNEMFHEVVPPLLHEDDLNAMYFSIENRTPFLDRNLFENCNRMPTQYLVKDGGAKAVLRDAMRGIVPDVILNERKKIGFNASILSFLDPKDDAVRSYLLDQSSIFDYVKKEPIEALLKKTEMPNSESKFLFYFISAKMFLEEFQGTEAIK
jgi:asparagine synthase (glutamine-hydrolysing)